VRFCSRVAGARKHSSASGRHTSVRTRLPAASGQRRVCRACNPLPRGVDRYPPSPVGNWNPDDELRAHEHGSHSTETVPCTGVVAPLSVIVTWHVAVLPPTQTLTELQGVPASVCGGAHSAVHGWSTSTLTTRDRMASGMGIRTVGGGHGGCVQGSASVPHAENPSSPIVTADAAAIATGFTASTSPSVRVYVRPATSSGSRSDRASRPRCRCSRASTAAGGRRSLGRRADARASARTRGVTSSGATSQMPGDCVVRPHCRGISTLGSAVAVVRCAFWSAGRRVGVLPSVTRRRAHGRNSRWWKKSFGGS
jgi:hypothetical protein